jgi:hypothetical protein
MIWGGGISVGSFGQENVEATIIAVRNKVNKIQAGVLVFFVFCMISRSSFSCILSWL